jgi:hypothetical protein
MFTSHEFKEILVSYCNEMTDEGEKSELLDLVYERLDIKLTEFSSND